MCSLYQVLMFVSLLGAFQNQPARLVTIGISRDAFEQHYRVQRDQTWCWATCAEMVLSYQGVTISQEAIVARVRGLPLAGPGRADELFNAINGVFQDEEGDTAIVSAQFTVPAPATTVLFNHLARQRPVILNYATEAWIGHSVVLTRVDVIVAPSGVTVTRLYVFDPYPYVLVFDPFGRPCWVFDQDRIYRVYDIRPNAQGNVELIQQDGTPIGVINAVILVDGTVL